MWFRSRRNGPC
ncbi:Protein of unknown function [Pyronema omphalodes CBS 100304]|uniref:Uncharacterized protein n=1 Tax=Pyronema omphalodes (strain CBS 100304) TaxID=1076935 RepID=U4LVU0_PYROM|nr:Protein of unknown function [Pyronema omphalodes CBS 100304]